MYISYFVLFLNFFIKAYLTKKPAEGLNKRNKDATNNLVNKSNKKNGHTDENNNVKSKKTN